MSGILYGVSVGPGDPELMTLKAARIIRETDCLALPGEVPRETLAYRIAAGAVPEVQNKKLIALRAPMTRDAGILADARRKNADLLERILDTGTDIACLTIGDISICSTFSYLQKIVTADGYRTEGISGVPSFCAAAADFGISLMEGDVPLHIVTPENVLPSKNAAEDGGTYVVMKCGRNAEKLREDFTSQEFAVRMVQNCGMPDEKKYDDDDIFPEHFGYFSLMIASKK